MPFRRHRLKGDAEDDQLRVVSLAKLKNGQDGRKWAFRLEELALGLDADGDAITSCVVAFEGAPDRHREPKSRRLNQWATIALGALQHITDTIETKPAPPLPGVPKHARSVPVAPVRDWALKTGIAGDGENPATIRSRWARALADIVAAGKAGKHGDELWLL